MNDFRSIPNGRKLTEQTTIFTPEQESGNGEFFYENCGNILTVAGNEMDERAVEAVKAAINRAKICKKPIAGYDREKKAAYVEYANGERKYAE